MKMIVLFLESSDVNSAKAQFGDALSNFNGSPVRVRITKSVPRLTDEDKVAKKQSKADKKAAAAQAKEAKATAKSEKTEAKAAKKAEKEAVKATKELSKKTTEPVQPTNIEKAAEKEINAPAKKSHHNKSKGY
jgi:cell division protein FtsN